MIASSSIATSLFPRFHATRRGPGRGGLLPLLLGLLALAGPAGAVDDSDELRVVNLSVTSEADLGDGTLEVEVGGDLRNRSTGSWSRASAVAVIEASELAAAGVEVIDAELQFPAISPRATVASSDVLTLRLPAERRAELDRALARGDLPFEVHGVEVATWAGPEVYLDAATASAFVQSETDGTRVQLDFDTPTQLLSHLDAGDLLTLGSYLPTRIARDVLPALVVSVDRPTPGKIRVVAETLSFATGLLESGTVSAGVRYDTGLETTTSVEGYLDSLNGCVEGGDVACGFSALPIRFDELEIASGVTLRGELLLRSSGVRLETRFRGGRMVRAVAGIDVGAYVTAEVEVKSSISTGPIEETVWTVTLPTVTVSLGGVPVTFTPIVDLKVGLEAELTAGTVFGLHQSVSAGVETGWRNGEGFTEPRGGIAPVTFSPPQLTSDTAATGRAWVAVEVLVLVQGLAGPFLRTEAYAQLEASPILDPWWSATYGLAGAAGIELQLIGMEVARFESEPWTYVEEVAASAEIVGGGAVALAPAAPRGEGGAEAPVEGAGDELPEPRTSGKDLRWAVGLQPSNTTYLQPRVTPLANGDALITSSARVGAGSLVRIGPSGEVLWAKELPLHQLPVNAAELPNGHLVLVGEETPKTWIAEHDADGNQLWSRAHDFELSTSVQDFVAFEDEAGQPAYLLALRSTVTTIRERDPVIARLDATGAVVWAKRLASDGVDEVYAITLLSDGNFALAGYTEADVGSDILMNAIGGGLVLKVDPDGNILWTTVFPTRWGGYFEAVVEGPDGAIYAGGTTGGVVTTDHPCLWVARVSPTDGQGTHVSIGEDFLWTHFVDSGAVGNETPIAEGQGRSLYDTIYGLAVSGDHIVAVGATGLGEGRAGLAIALTTKLGVAWHTTFDGPYADLLTDTADAGGGLWVVGSSNSFANLADGAENVLLAMKLPYEGGVTFDPSWTAMCRYVQPESFASIADEDFSSSGATQGGVQYAVLDVSSVQVVAPLAPLDDSWTALRLTKFPPPAAPAEPEPEPVSERFIRGDCNGDGVVQGIPDAMLLLRHNFLGSRELPCAAACDSNGDGSTSGLADAVHVLRFSFLGGPPPVPPYPGCGEGALATDEALGCEAGPASCDA